MRAAADVVRTLRRRGDLWEPAPGLVGLRGDAQRLYRRLAELLEAAAAGVTDDVVAPPPGIAFDALARGGYFECFPHWLTAAAHLGNDQSTLERVARDASPGTRAARSLRPAEAALSPALCYHVYGLHADRRLPAGPILVTLEGTCWRRESVFRPLERGWAFTMREIVCLGTSEQVEGFRREWSRRTRALARSLGLDGRVAPATDPFFEPTSRGRQLRQKLEGLKEELLLPLGGGAHTAAASFNHHQTFFGSAFDIRLPDGELASSACVAFGLERWTLAFLVVHGTDPHDWPAIEPAEVLAGATP